MRGSFARCGGAEVADGHVGFGIISKAQVRFSVEPFDVPIRQPPL